MFYLFSFNVGLFTFFERNVSCFLCFDFWKRKTFWRKINKNCMEKKERRRKLINKLYEIHSHTHDCILFGTCYVAFQVVSLCCYVDVEKERKRERDMRIIPKLNIFTLIINSLIVNELGGLFMNEQRTELNKRQRHQTKEEIQNE